MRLTDNRYASEKAQFELALRMIQHEARTRTIRECTGLSDDRIRKVYATYFRDTGPQPVRRRRGKSPQQIGMFVKTPANQLEATTLVALFCASLLLRVDPGNRVLAAPGCRIRTPGLPGLRNLRTPSPVPGAQLRMGLEPSAQHQHG